MIAIGGKSWQVVTGKDELWQMGVCGDRWWLEVADGCKW